MEQDDPPGRASGPPATAQETPLSLDGHEFDRPLAELSTREPVCCEPGTPLRDALETMRRERVGSIVVVDALRRPLGIITLGDVLARVTLPQIRLETPVGEVMSVNLRTAPAHAPAFEAALLMARENIRHVPLVSDGRLVGVVSESRLFALWRRSIGAVRAGIVEARDIDSIVQAAQGIRGLPAKLLAAGLTADAVTALLTSLNDMLVERLLDLTGAGAALREVHGCWIALGSQGRCEQTLATDQDNAILFDTSVDPDACRRTLLPLALEVNRALDRCGFALCRGDIMASNPAWCLSQAEWKARFASWIDRPDAQALLNAAIFFDFRPIGGAHPLVGELRAWLAGHARGSNLFLLQMVMNAQGNEPPLGLLRDFVVQRGGAHPNTLDLKTNGVQAFVEAARIYALSSGVQSTNTVARFQEAARARGLQEHESAAWCDAFRTLQRIRLQLNMRQLEQGVETHNFLDPDRLNILDRQVLKESLRQARSLQSRLTLDFARGGFHG